MEGGEKKKTTIASLLNSQPVSDSAYAIYCKILEERGEKEGESHPSLLYPANQQEDHSRPKH